MMTNWRVAVRLVLGALVFGLIYQFIVAPFVGDLADDWHFLHAARMQQQQRPPAP